MGPPGCGRPDLRGGRADRSGWSELPSRLAAGPPGPALPLREYGFAAPAARARSPTASRPRLEPALRRASASASAIAAAVRIAVLGPLGERALDDSRPAPPAVRAGSGGGGSCRWRSASSTAEPPVNGGSPGEHLVEHDAGAVDVGRGRRRARRAPARAPCTAASRRSSPTAPSRAALGEPRDAEVADLDPSRRGDQDVGRLDVAVDDPLRRARCASARHSCSAIAARLPRRRAAPRRSRSARLSPSTSSAT